MEVTPPQFNHVFFTNSGSEANDTNIRLIQRYYGLLGKPEKKNIISRRNAYHGSTIAAASLGGMGAMHAQTNGLDYVTISTSPTGSSKGRRQPRGVRAARGARAGAKIDELGQDKVAAFIAEPVQGSGGVIIPRYLLAEIKRICRERYPAGDGRGHLWLWPHRQLVRLRDLRPRSPTC